MRRLTLTMMMLLCAFNVNAEGFWSRIKKFEPAKQEVQREEPILTSINDIAIWALEFNTDMVDFIVDALTMDLRTEEEKAFERKEIECLARNIYFEAGHEPYDGRVAVAQVTRNRVEHEGYPKTFCEVIYQRNKKYCQFSWTCDRKPDRIRNEEAYDAAYKIAEEVLTNDLQSDIIGSNALFYHATYVNPKWSKQLKRVARIGLHVFYAPPNNWTAWEPAPRGRGT